MIRLSYISHTDRNFPEDELAKILAVARKRNAAVGITGMLIYERGTFLQVIEGPENAVRSCFARISKDKRHVELCLLQEAVTDERFFGEWSMGFANPISMPKNERENVKSLTEIATRIAKLKGRTTKLEMQRVALRIESFLLRAKARAEIAAQANV